MITHFEKPFNWMTLLDIDIKKSDVRSVLYDTMIRWWWTRIRILLFTSDDRRCAAGWLAAVAGTQPRSTSQLAALCSHFGNNNDTTKQYIIMYACCLSLMLCYAAILYDWRPACGALAASYSGGTVYVLAKQEWLAVLCMLRPPADVPCLLRREKLASKHVST